LEIRACTGGIIQPPGKSFDSRMQGHRHNDTSNIRARAVCPAATIILQRDREL
jgi:hypothetical protein